MSEAKFDRKTWRRLKTLAKPFFVSSDVRWTARLLLCLLVLFALTISGMNVIMSYIGRDFMTALSIRDKSEFTKQLYFYLGAFAVATPIVVFQRYTEERLGLLWRKWLTRKVLGDYFKDHSFYKLNISGAIDNPDQRIEEDIRSFTSQSLSFLLILFNSLITLYAFIGILWDISPTLVLAVVAYSIFGSIISYFLGRPLIGLNFAQLKKEADFRYKLVNVRDNSESIAFYRGESLELTRTRQRLREALKNLLSVINWNRNLSFFTTGYNYLVTILPTIIVAPLYIEGSLEFGQVTQAQFAFGMVLGALAIIVQNFQSLSAFAAVITRLGSFTEALLESSLQNKEKGFGVIKADEGNELKFEKITIITPVRHQTLIKDLTFKLNGKSLLIVGPSGSGKSSILRVLSGLWHSGDGSILRPPLDSSFFLPQRPYMILGSLRTQLVYGVNKKGIMDKELMSVMRSVGLSETFKRIGGLDTALDWPNMLSSGEQQRLAFARLLLSSPKTAYLDEATTALDSRAEEKMYSLIKENVEFYVSVGDFDSLSKYHDEVLELFGDGTWRVYKGADTWLG